MPTHTPDEARTVVAHWNTRRHGWTRFQTSTRRTTERLIQKLADRCPYCYSTDGELKFPIRNPSRATRGPRASTLIRFPSCVVCTSRASASG